MIGNVHQEYVFVTTVGTSNRNTECQSAAYSDQQVEQRKLCVEGWQQPPSPSG